MLHVHVSVVPSVAGTRWRRESASSYLRASPCACGVIPIFRVAYRVLAGLVGGRVLNCTSSGQRGVLLVTRCMQVYR